VEPGRESALIAAKCLFPTRAARGVSGTAGKKNAGRRVIGRVRENITERSGKIQRGWRRKVSGSGIGRRKIPGRQKGKSLKKVAKKMNVYVIQSEGQSVLSAMIYVMTLFSIILVLKEL